MGTNYHWYSEPCPCCGRSETLHIGKSSYGWNFALHVIPEQGLHDLDDWVGRFNTGGHIENEYGHTIPVEEMMSVITEREETYRPDSLSTLAHHEVDGRHCIGHGSGTWDLITGDFS